MTSLHSAYTPLESLLLFQALRSEGVHAISFNRISEQLKSIPLVHNDPSYDSGRLSPDALRELYLGLLKDEVKRDLERQSHADAQHATVNGDGSPGSRKRKAASPSLPTVHEAAQHYHLIPRLVSRLYARYRENVVRGLRENERRHGAISRDLAEIEAGKWDERLQRVKAPPAKPSPKPSSAAHVQPTVARSETVQATPLPPAGPTSAQATVENTNTTKRYPQTTIDAVINHGPEQASSPSDRQTPLPNNTLSSTPTVSQNTLHRALPGQLHPSAHVQSPSQSNTARPAAGGYAQPSPTGHQSPYPPQQNVLPIHPSSVPGPSVQQAAVRTPSSPRPILPPPAGVKTPAAFPAQQATSTGTQTTHATPQSHLPPQNRMPALPSPTNDHQSQDRVPSQVHPGVGPYHPNRRVSHPSQQQGPTHVLPHQQTPYVDLRTSYPAVAPSTPTYAAPPPPHPGRPMLAPFQIAPPDTAKGQHQTPQQRPQPPSSLGQPPPARYMRHPPNAPATAPRNLARSDWSLVSDIVQALATPPRPKSGSLWKNDYRPMSISVSTELPRPDIEPMSPSHERPRSPARSTRSARSRDPRTNEESAQSTLPVKGRPGRRRATVRAGSPHSVVSSSVEEAPRARTRSQSVSTAAGAAAAGDDRPGSRNGVKAEPSTPANMLEDPDSTPVPLATPASGPRTRKRRGTLQAQHAPPSKRRLRESPGAPDHEPDVYSSPPRRGNTVVAARNFAKMSATVMNDINSHKHASYFATAVRDRDAPGYGEIVMQPQNLKSIRAAVTAGSRAVHSATSALDSPTGTPAAPASRSFEGSSTVELERTVDLIPPKAIVNGGQLEKELMRMFANAYMFNPGEDGMALITKEMFRDVEQTLNDWRGTERETGGDEDDDGKGKRRKL